MEDGERASPRAYTPAPCAVTSEDTVSGCQSSHLESIKFQSDICVNKFVGGKLMFFLSSLKKKMAVFSPCTIGVVAAGAASRGAHVT